MNIFAEANTLNSDRLQEIKELEGSAAAGADFDIKLKKLMAMLDQFSNKRKLDCEFSFGHEKFCTCLNEKLPISIDFIQYVNVMISDKNKLLKKLGSKDKEIVILTYQARDACASLL